MKDEVTLRNTNEGTKIYWEDFKVGDQKFLGSLKITKEEILSFAERYDPQYFHINEDEAKKSVFNGLIASGWQTCSLIMRIICDSYLINTSSFGSPGIENLKWLKPVRPNDEINLYRKVLSTRQSKSNPIIGIVMVLFKAFNQKDELVLEMTVCQMIGKKGN